jgi:UDP-N-acetylmuramoylalanine--D-glutamate ligase
MITDFKRKKITVVGLAKSGVGAANLLSRLGAKVTVTDIKGIEDVQTHLKKLDSGINLELGNHPSWLFDDIDLIVVSPGVPLDAAPFKTAVEKGIKVIGELELAYQVIKHESGIRNQSPEFLAVTGTNGKSTTTALLYEIVKNSGFNAIVGGNIGNALTEEISNFKFQISNFDFIVTEVSSFQLETIESFRPKGSTILNITPDHLDRYHLMDRYIDAKCRIFLNQAAGDFLVLNADDPVTEEIIKRFNGEGEKGKGSPAIFYFSRKNEVNGAYYKEDVIHFNIPGIAESCVLNPESFRIKGVHNIENAMAASIMALLCGCNINAVSDTLKTFPGLEHSLEFVREINGIKFINDSKGTNVGAVMKSLESFNNPVILIAGGRDKDSDFSILKPLVRDKVKALILIGEARGKIKKAVGEATEVFMEDDFKSAVLRAKSVAQAGDVVLLSPACASFDMFKNFEDRGRQFKRLVMEI